MVILLRFTAIFVLPIAVWAQPRLELLSSAGSQVFAGDKVVFQAAASGTGAFSYRFRISRDGGPYRMIRDFGNLESIDWATENEGFYEMEVSARENVSGDVATAVQSFGVASRGYYQPVVDGTAHPMVWLYSAPPCPEGSSMLVEMRAAGAETVRTHTKLCDGQRGMNFYLAGLRPETAYGVRHLVDGEEGPELSLETPPGLAPVKGGGPGGLLLHGPVDASPYATDLAGNVVWQYHDWFSKLTRPGPNGTMWGEIEVHGADTSWQLLREIDLLGTTLRETSAARVNEQLAALGYAPITAFHHEVRPLPDGRILALASSERILTDIQGPGPVDVLGDTIIVMDEDLQVLWVWDSFDHLDPRQAAIFGETCSFASAGCPPFYLSETANDWTHGNSVSLAPDGNLVFSIRHLDQVIKIDYRNGEGDGSVLWRLGKNGDFRYLSQDPYPWFSHQHDAGFELGDGERLLLFDNANAHRVLNPQANSRGQIVRIDETRRTATLELNADLGGYAAALGSAQPLPSGNYHFNLGILLPRRTARAVEVNGRGQTVATYDSPEMLYRSFRLQSLYRPD